MPGIAFPLRPQPILVETAHAGVAPDFAEGVHVAVAGAARPTPLLLRSSPEGAGWLPQGRAVAASP